MMRGIVSFCIALVFCGICVECIRVPNTDQKKINLPRATGSYPSGEYAGLVSLAAVHVVIKDSDVLTFQAGFMGSKILCTDERYAFDASSMQLNMLDWGKPDDCLTKVFEEQKSILGDVFILMFVPNEDALEVTIKLGTYKLYKKGEGSAQLSD